MDLNHPPQGARFRTGPHRPGGAESRRTARRAAAAPRRTGAEKPQHGHDVVRISGTNHVRDAGVQRPGSHLYNVSLKFADDDNAGSLEAAGADNPQGGMAAVFVVDVSDYVHTGTHPAKVKYCKHQPTQRQHRKCACLHAVRRGLQGNDGLFSLQVLSLVSRRPALSGCIPQQTGFTPRLMAW